MKKWTIGIDLGGTEIKMGLFDEHMEKNWSVPTRLGEGGKYIFEDIAMSVKNVCDLYQIDLEDLKGIGMGVPGPVTGERVVRHCVNLGWGETDVCQCLSEQLCLAFGCDYKELNISVANDANVAALGEKWMGGGKDFDSLAMVTLGTGVGGGIIINGKIWNGATGAGGEVGHILCVDDQDISGRCSCGHKGCIEQIASATGIVNYAKLYLEHAPEASVLHALLRTEGKFTAKDVMDAAKSGDVSAEKIIDKVLMYLGKGLAIICDTINPECVVIGGGVSAAGEYLRAKVEHYFRVYAFPGVEDTPIRLATMGNQAGIAGAAYMIISKHG